MTAFDRFETRLPELMTELAQPTTPDYVTDMLRQTARTRQRPAWSALERWLPMGAVARTLLPVRYLPWRPVLVAALMVALAVAALVLYSGSRASLPPPFGPARNGALLTSTSGGDILSFDPVTGKATSVLAAGGDSVTFSSTGQLFSYDKNTAGLPEIWVANADGSGGHKVWSGPASTTSIEWAQDGKRLVMADHPATGGTKVHLVDAATGTETTVAFDKVFTTVSAPFGSHTLLLTMQPDGQPSIFYLANEDGSSLRALPAVTPVNFATLSPDGKRIAYASWQDAYAKRGRLHVLDLATETDVALDSDTNILLSPIFSPDGTQIAAQRFVEGTPGYDITVLTVDGSKAQIVLGTNHVSNDKGVSFSFAPDGSKLIARYPDDSTAWLFDTSGGAAQQLSGITTEFFSWQRAGE